MCKTFLIIEVLVCLLGVTVPALTVQAQDEVRLQLEQINQEIESTKASWQLINKRQGVIKRDLQMMHDQIAKIRVIESEKQAALRALNSKLDQTRASLLTLAERKDNLVKLARTRARVLYLTRSETLGAKVLNAVVQSEQAAEVDFLKTAFYFSRIRQADFKALQQLSDLFVQESSARQNLERYIEQQKSLQITLSQQRETMSVRLQAQQELIEALNKERRQAEASLLQLKAQALRFETVLASLMSGPSISESANDSARTLGSSYDRQFEGIGLSKQIGSLVVPVTGKVVVGFGGVSVSGDSIIGGNATVAGPGVASKGIDFLVKGDLKVKAIAAGRAAFVGDLPRLGAVVIIDHGKRSYSLYGRLSTVILQPGQDVASGEQIATLNQPHEGGANFYFEIRLDAKPVDPKKLLKFP